MYTEELLQQVREAKVSTVKMRLPEEYGQRLRTLASLEGLPLQDFLGLVLAQAVMVLWAEALARDFQRRE